MSASNVSPASPEVKPFFAVAGNGAASGRAARRALSAETDRLFAEARRAAAPTPAPERANADRLAWLRSLDLIERETRRLAALDTVRRGTALTGITETGNVFPPEPQPSETDIRVETRRLRRALRIAMRKSREQLADRAAGLRAGKPPLFILKTPTGMGKTENVCAQIREDIARHPLGWVRRPDGAWVEGHQPALVLGPNYALLDEIRERLRDPNRPFDSTRPDSPALPATLPAVDVDRYPGRLRAGCDREDEYLALVRSGRNAAKLCRQVVKNPDGTITEHVCPFAATCGANARTRLFNEDPVGNGVWVDGELEPCDLRFIDAEGRERLNNVPDVLLAPHAHVTAGGLPLAVAQPRYFVIDESTVFALMGQTVLPIRALEVPDRREPTPTEKEAAAGLTGKALLAEYKAVCASMAARLKAGEDSAEALMRTVLSRLERPEALDWASVSRKTWATAMAIVTRAKRIAYSSTRNDADIPPSLTESPDLDLVKAIAARPMPAFAPEEWRFWSIIQDRLRLIRDREIVKRRQACRNAERAVAADVDQAVLGADVADEALDPALLEAEQDGFGGDDGYDDEALDGELAMPRARDIRITYVPESGQIELAWRNRLHWTKTPGIILDASANESMYQALLGRHFSITFKDFVGTVRQRTVVAWGCGFATSSLLPAADAQPWTETWTDSNGVAHTRVRDPHEEAAARRLMLQRALLAIAMHHQGGDILVGATKRVKEEMASWALGATLALANPDAAGALEGEDAFAAADAGLRYGHFGALRGLDYAKLFAAAVCVGKLELPDDVVRRLGRALAYDQPETEDEVLEPLATDRPGDPKTTVKRLYRMRDGREVSIDTRVYRNRWEALVQGQRREEEIIQFAGRLRTYHKTHLGVDPARWQTLWLLGNVIPEGTILDDVVHVHDLAERGKIHECAAAAAGVVAPETWLEMGFVEERKGERKGSDPGASAYAALRRAGFADNLPTPAASPRCGCTAAARVVRAPCSSRRRAARIPPRRSGPTPLPMGSPPPALTSWRRSRCARAA